MEATSQAAKGAEQSQNLPSIFNNKSQFLKDLYSATTNKTYVDHILSHPFFSGLTNFLQQNQEASLEDVKELIGKLSVEYRQSVDSYADLVEIVYGVFVREAVTGPSVYTQYVSETKAPIVKGGPLPPSEMDPLSNKNQHLQDLLLVHFERDSEQIYLKTQFLVLFYALEILLGELPEGEEQNQGSVFLLWRARFSLLHDQQLTSSVTHLKDSSLSYYEKYLNHFENEYNLKLSDLTTTEEQKQELKQRFVHLLIEASHCYLNFYKYKECKRCINQSKQLLNLNFKLTGRLGRRTKYQEFDIAQLVLDIENREVQVIKKETDFNSELEAAAKTAYGDTDGVDPDIQNNLEEERKNQNIKLETETILYETPKITDPEGELATRELSVEDQLVIQAYVNYIAKTHAKDETRMELLRPFINTCLTKPNNWLVYSFGLLLRSRNELDKTKTTERALMQLQTLIDQYRDKEPGLGVRIAYYQASGYPLYWELQRELAKCYQKIGVYVSAYELLKEVELYEDCILSMFMAGRQTLATELANERLAKSKIAQPGILCLLGDIKKDVNYYQQAWDVSNQKYARAMRSMARIHYFHGEYQKSADCYEQALAISRLYPDAWFTLGCAYMRLEDFKQSVFAFGVSISIDETNPEAWCNISTCHMRMDKYKEAVMCLEQALKQNRKSWKIWENYIILSIECLLFYKAVSAARELMRIDMTERLNVNLMLKICDVFLKNYVAKPDVTEDEKAIAKRQLYSFFDEYTSKVAKDWQVWRLIGRIKLILKESPEVIKELKLKEIRALMNINWENTIETCEKIERSLDELLKMRTAVQITPEEKIFAKNTITAIELCLHRKTTIESFD